MSICYLKNTEEYSNKTRNKHLRLFVHFHLLFSSSSFKYSFALPVFSCTFPFALSIFLSVSFLLSFVVFSHCSFSSSFALFFLCCTFAFALSIFPSVSFLLSFVAFPH